jgi:hypothetical protein
MRSMRAAVLEAGGKLGVGGVDIERRGIRTSLRIA